MEDPHLIAALRLTANMLQPLGIAAVMEEGAKKLEATIVKNINLHQRIDNLCAYRDQLKVRLEALGQPSHWIDPEPEPGPQPPPS